MKVLKIILLSIIFAGSAFAYPSGGYYNAARQQESNAIREQLNAMNSKSKPIREYHQKMARYYFQKSRELDRVGQQIDMNLSGRPVYGY